MRSTVHSLGAGRNQSEIVRNNWFVAWGDAVEKQCVWAGRMYLFIYFPAWARRLRARIEHQQEVQVTLRLRYFTCAYLLIVAETPNLTACPRASFELSIIRTNRKVPTIVHRPRILPRPRRLFSLIHSKNTCSLSQFSEQFCQRQQTKRDTTAAPQRSCRRVRAQLWIRFATVRTRANLNSICCVPCARARARVFPTRFSRRFFSRAQQTRFSLCLCRTKCQCTVTCTKVEILFFG